MGWSPKYGIASSTNHRRWFTAVARPSRTSDWTCWSPVIFDIRVLPGFRYIEWTRHWSALSCGHYRIRSEQTHRRAEPIPMNRARCRTVTRTTVGEGTGARKRAGILPARFGGEDGSWVSAFLVNRFSVRMTVPQRSNHTRLRTVPTRTG